MSAQNTSQKDSIFLNTIINNMVQGVVTVDHNGVIKSFNKRAESIFQYNAEDIVGEKATILMPEPDQYKDDEAVKKYLAVNSKKETGISREVFGRKQDGTLFPICLTIIEANIADEPIFISLILDMTDQKDRETRLDNLREDAEKANQANQIFWPTCRMNYAHPSTASLASHVCLLKILNSQETIMLWHKQFISLQQTYLKM